MAERGAFDGVDAAMMVHPAGADLLRMDAIAIQQLEVDYHGQAAHAAAAPGTGRNALDAAVLGYMNVAALRQHIRPDERVHGIFTDGGDKPNIVPGPRRPCSGTCAPPTVEPLATVEGAGARRAWQAGADGRRLRDGARVAGPAVRRHGRQPAADRPLRRQRGPPRADRRSTPMPTTSVVGSTDMGNVSYVVPIDPPDDHGGAADGVDPHARVRRPRRADRTATPAVLDGAKAMAMTVADLWLSADVPGRRPGFVRGHGPREPFGRRGPRAHVRPAVRSAARERVRRRGVHAPTRPTSSGGTSPTSTARCSRWSTCPRS